MDSQQFQQFQEFQKLMQKQKEVKVNLFNWHVIVIYSVWSLNKVENYSFIIVRYSLEHVSFYIMTSSTPVIP